MTRPEPSNFYSLSQKQVASTRRSSVKVTVNFTFVCGICKFILDFRSDFKTAYNIVSFISNAAFALFPGVKVIGECLATSNRDETKEAASVLLESLSHGNPRYQDQVYKYLITCMTCSSPKSLQLILHTLCIVQVKPATYRVCTKLHITAVSLCVAELIFSFKHFFSCSEK